MPQWTEEAFAQRPKGGTLDELVLGQHERDQFRIRRSWTWWPVRLDGDAMS